jgi:hypothetical protein
MANKKISELPYINGGEISGNTLVPLVTYYSATTGDTVHTYITDLQNYLTSGITISGDFLPLSGGTVSGGTQFTVGLTANTISATTYQNLPSATFSGGTVTGPTIFTNGLTANTISATTYQNLPTDIRVTGATYSNNTFTYTNNTGDTFSTLFNTVTGLTVNGGLTITGNTSAQGLTATTISATTYQNLPTDIRVTGGTYSAGTISFTNNTGGTFNVTGLTTGSTSTVSGDFLPLSGGTVSGATRFLSGLTANTISADTLTVTDNISSTNRTLYRATPLIGFSESVDYGNSKLWGVNAPSIDWELRQIYDEQSTMAINYSGVTRYLIDDIGQTSVDWQARKLYTTIGEEVFDWENGLLTGQTNIESSTISATTYQNLPISGLTEGNNINISGSNGNYTVSVTGLTQGLSGDYLPLSGGTVSGGTIFTSGLTANTLNVTGLTQTKGITSTGGITFKQITINSSYTATTDDYMIDVTGGTFTVSLPTAVGIQGRLLVVKNNGGGAVTVDPFGSETIDGKPFVILGETNTIQLSSNGSEWVALSYNISTVNSSTGVFEFTGLSIASTTTFNVAPVKGWIVDDTTNPLSPQLYYVYYSGGTHTATYVTTATETWVYLTSGGTISQSNIELTEQQRRENIFLGKLGHANKTNIINAFSQPDFVLSPLSQLRDMFNPIGFINGGIYASPNGVNLSFNTSAGYLYGLGINFANDTLNPNSLYVSGTTPCTFQYRTQTGGTASNTTSIDPTKWDVGGVVTTISGTKATNQRIYLVQNGIFRVQYGQTEYNQLSAAIEGIATEQFNTFSNFTNNGILIGVLSVLSTATDLSDTSKARFFFTSKFGETVGVAGGISTTTLQQAYNNSTTPEITTNSTLGPLSVKNGAGTLDNVTNVFEGVNAAGTTTSYVRADGFISGNSLNAPNLIISGGTQSIFSGNSSSDLVRITQTGVGNSFVVDDSTNPDSTPFVINSGGSVSIGTTSVFSVGAGAETKLNVSTGSSGVATTGLSVSTPVIIESTVGTSIGLFNPDVANSQMYFGTPSDAFGAFLRWDYTNRNLILSTANGTGKLIFQTANAVEAARIDQSGNMGIGLTGATQKFEVSGNSVLNGSVTAGTTTINGNLTVTGNTNVRAFTGTTGYISGSGQNILTVIGSGNSTTSPLFTVQGSSGELFSVNDSLVGSLFSVNDISGLPIVEVFSDNTTLWGSYQAPSLNTTTRTSLTAGTNTIYSIPTSAYTGAFYEYTLISTGTTGARAGQIMSIWSGTSANFTETSTLDIGTTTGVTFTVAVSGNNAVLSSSATTTGWTLKTIVRSI